MRIATTLAGIATLTMLSAGGATPPAPKTATLIRDVVIVDGTGAAPERGSVRIVADRIAAIGDLTALPGDAIVDGSGLTLAPGFIDTHSHHDDELASSPDALAAVSQGITTIVRGQDGFAGRLSGGYQTVAHFNAMYTQNPAAINVASYSAHNTIRERVMGSDFRREASSAEIADMAELVDADMHAGALGLATGLEYDPGIYASTLEVIRLARIAALHGGRYASHIRSEDRGFWAALDEAMRIGRDAGLPVHISHLKLAMRSLWGQVDRVARLFAEARAQGIEVSADIYPYEYWQSTVTVLFPDRDFADREVAQFVLDELVPPDGLIFVRYDADPDVVGKSLAALAAERETPAAELLTTLTSEGAAYSERTDTQSEYILGRSMRDEDIRRLLALPRINVCSDGSLASEHPRGSGAFTRVLGKYVRDEPALSLTDAVHRMTGIAADNAGIVERGRVVTGNFADLVLFDADRVADRATVEDSDALSVGIHTVWVNGEAVFHDGRSTGARPGRIVLRDDGDAADAP